MKRGFIGLALSFVLGFGISTCKSSQNGSLKDINGSENKQDFELLGTATLARSDQNINSDVVKLVGTCDGFGNPPVNKVQLAIKASDVEIDHIEVTFGNGERQELSVKDRFPKDTKSRDIDLTGGARCIRSLFVVGRAVGDGTKPALIRLWGIRDSQSQMQTGVRWLGRAFLDNGSDQAEFKVANKLGKADSVDAIRIVVRTNPAQIDRLHIVFGNGTTQDVTIQRFFNIGDQTPWIDLPGGLRFITKVEIFGRFIADQQALDNSPLVSAPIATEDRTDRSSVSIQGKNTEAFNAANAKDLKDKEFLGATDLASSGSSTSAQVIRLKGTCDSVGNPPVHQIQLVTRNSDAQIDFVGVTFGNGDRQELRVNQTLKKDSKSREIDLDGAARCVREFVVVGKSTDPNGRQASIRIWGVRDALEQLESGVRRLGAVQLQFGQENDPMLVENSLGSADTISAFRAIVRGNDAQIDRLIFSFGDGTTHVVEVSKLVLNGEASEWIDFPRGRRNITNIQVIGRTVRSLLGDGEDKARILVNGRML
ncbi:MAG: DUF2541 family protein [Proteobacteria bacterium]|nr:DUF2541 family protein [Pseudomonadota bacterium]